MSEEGKPPRSLKDVKPDSVGRYSGHGAKPKGDGGIVLRFQYILGTTKISMRAIDVSRSSGIMARLRAPHGTRAAAA